MSFSTTFFHPPVWVLALFGALLVLGLQATKTRIVPLWRVLAMPAFFVAWGFYSLSVHSELAAWWLASLVPAAVVSWRLSDASGLEFKGEAGTVRMIGSFAMLARSMLIFLTKYLIAIAIVSGVADRHLLQVLDVIVSGLSAGYFVGWIGRFAQAWKASTVPAT